MAREYLIRDLTFLAHLVMTLLLQQLVQQQGHALYAEDVQTILHKSLDALGRQTRRVFMLSRFDGMSNRQIAQELGISEKSVEYHVTKALKQLRTDLKDYLPLIYLFLGI